VHVVINGEVSRQTNRAMRAKQTFATLLLLACVPYFAANARTSHQKQARPNLSGTWTMEQSKTKESILNPPELTLIIAHQEPEIRIKRRFTLGGRQQEQDLIYYTDRRGESNVTLGGGKNKSDSRTKWERDRLVIRYPPYSAQIARQSVTAQLEVEWQIQGGVLVEKLTTTYRGDNTSVDSSISASDRGALPMIPPTLVVKRVYKKEP